MKPTGFPISAASLFAGLLGGLCWMPLWADPPPVTPPARESVDVYLLMGQSNMAGRDTRQLAAQEDQPRVIALDADGNWRVARDPIHPQDGRIEPGAGPGIPFALEMLKADPKTTIALVPCAVGGSPLKRWVKGGDLYTRALERAKAAAKDGVIRGVLWHQGETDTTNLKNADTYEARLTGMITDLRTDLGQPELPVVVGQLGDFLSLTPEKYPFAGTVRTAIRHLPTVVPHTGYADSAGLVDQGDKLHFSAEAQKEMGKRYAAAMQPLLRQEMVRIARFAGDRAAAISYTFDDGLRDQFQVAVPMLNQRGFKGTFFIIAGKTAETPEQGEQRKADPKLRNRWGGISWPELRAMADQGHEIANHTWSHPGLANLTPAEVDAELSKAHQEILTRTGRPPLTVAFPFNQSTPAIQQVALKQHLAYRAFQTGTSETSTAASLNTWADRLVTDNRWGILMIHAVADGYAAFSDPQVFSNHLQHVKDREADIWVDTFADIVRYEKERSDAKLAVTADDHEVTFTLTGTLDPQVFNRPLTVVIKAPGTTPATAIRDARELPAKRLDGSIQVDAIPGPAPITVRWK